MSCSKDNKTKFKASVAIPGQALSGTTDIVGEIIDTQDFESLSFVLQMSAIAVGTLVAQLLIEEGDASNLSDAAAVADIDLNGTEAETAVDENDVNGTKKIGYTGNKRYVRATLTVTTNTGTDVVSCSTIQGHPAASPVA